MARSYRGGAALLFVIGSSVSIAAAQTSPSYQIQSSAIAAGGGTRTSASYSIQADCFGQALAGLSGSPGFATQGGLLTTQLLDLSSPAAPLVSDGAGSDIDRTIDSSQICFNWSASDPQSGIFENLVSLGSSPGADNVRSAAFLGAAPAACLAGPFGLCGTYYLTVQSRNGAHGLSPAGTSDGILVDDALDTDSDATGNACDADDDNDGLADLSDTCPCDPNNDSDGDGVCANHPLCGGDHDNCPTVANPTQSDMNGNGVGDPCDAGCVLIAGSGPGADCSVIQDCIDAAGPGCTIRIDVGTWFENLVLDRTLRLSGAGAGATIVQGLAGSPTVRVIDAAAQGKSRLDGLTLSGGSAGLHTTRDVVMTDVIVDGAATGVEFAAPAAGAAPVVRLERSWIRDSTSKGAVAHAGRLEAVDTLITDSGSECLRIETGATALVDFSTISRCATGIFQQGGGAGALQLTHSIVWGSLTTDLAGVACASVASSDLQTSCCGQAGNLCVDPVFVSPAGADFRLAGGSPAIDTALAAAQFSGEPCLDHLSSPRLLDGNGDGLPDADMGAHEFAFAPGGTPGEVQGLMVGSPSLLNWNAVGGATRYQVYRSDTTSVGYGNSFTCLGTSLTNQFTLDGSLPPAGQSFLYVITVRTGGPEGPAGYGTCAQQPAASVCP